MLRSTAISGMPQRSLVQPWYSLGRDSLVAEVLGRLDTCVCCGADCMIAEMAAV